MADKAIAALFVKDLDASSNFYTQYFDFELVEPPSESGTALVRDSDGWLFLLADSRVEDAKSLLNGPRIVFKPGSTLDYDGIDLESRKAAMIEKGLPATQIQEAVSVFGDRRLIVSDINGYRFSFQAKNMRTPEETMAIYACCHESIVESLKGLSEDELDLKRAPDEWSIRQIIHHFAESSSLFLIPIKIALAQPGGTCQQTYSQELWADKLGYASRPIEPSLALVHAIQTHILQLLKHVPGSWEHNVVMQRGTGGGEGRNTTVGRMIEIQVLHTAEHIEEIRETRKIHNR